jgi:putative PEP-CTERM system TPR-repeat lipoprotein
LLVLAGCGEPTAADRQKAAQKAMEKGDHAAALIELKSALQAEPNSGPLRLGLASLLLETGDPAGAVVELRKAAEQGYNAEVVTARLATALVASGKFKDVTDTYATVTLTDAAARAELGSAVAAAWLGQRAPGPARKVAEETLKSAPDHGPALLVLARLRAMDNKIDEALALTEKAAAKGPGVGEAHLLRALLLAAGKKDRAGAQAAFELAAKHPSVALGARSGLIQLHLGGRDLPKAKAELALLKKSHPKHPNTVYLSALLAYADGKLEQMEPLTDALLKLAPDNAQVLTLSGAGHLRRGALVAAESRLGRVVQTVDKAPLARKLLADTYLRMGQSDKALATLGPLLAEGGDADVLALAAQAHLQRGQVADAEAAFNAALKIKPDDINLRTSMALTDLAKGKPDAAFGALQQLAEQDSGQTADLALISAHLQRREFDRALTAIGRLERKLPKAAMPLHMRGVALMGSGDRAGARQAFEAALAAEPSYFESTAMLAALDSKAGKHDAAQARIEAAIKLAPQNLAARMALVDVLRARHSPPDQVLKAIDEAVRTHPTEAAPHLAKLAHLEKHRGIKDAAGHAQVAMAALPNDPQILDAAGRALAAAGEDQQAMAAFNRMTPAMPKSPLPYLRLADVYGKRGNRAEVASLLNRAFEVAPESPAVQRRLLDHAERSKDYKAVLAAAKELQRRQPNSAAGHLLEGDVESSRKAWAAAKAAYQAALAKPDGKSVTPRAYYTALQRGGEAAQAQRFAADWLKSNPKDVNLRGLLGSEAILAGRLADAEKYFREIVEVEPRSAAALNNLAWLLAERKDPGALQMAERALELSPDSPSVLDTMAKAYEAAGQPQRAVELQRRAADAEGALPSHRLTLARMLVKTGEKRDAAAELDRLQVAGLQQHQKAEVQELRKLVTK